LYGHGFRPQDLKVESGEAAPPSVERAVKQHVVKEITEEAVKKVEQALATGKGIDDALAPYAKLYGYENVNQFALELLGFWDLWHGQVDAMFKELQVMRWAFGELQRKLSPEALQALKTVSINEITQSVLLAAAQTGKYPEAELLREYIQVVKEEIEG
jgi:hypothetical protein